MANNVVEILKGVVGELREIAKSETVIGKPVTVGDKTVIPVVKLSIGFGAGGGEGTHTKQSGYGGGGGGGARIEPAAFIIMDADGIRLLPMGRGKWEGLVEAIPGLVRKLGLVKDEKDSSTEAEGKE
jgi:uncharacterized spore protein YtfJ